jgi:hypothetical protein
MAAAALLVAACWFANRHLDAYLESRLPSATAD